MVKLSVYQPVPNVCTGSNPTWGQFFSIFFFTASDAGKAVYIHKQHSMGDAPYVGSRLGDDYKYKPQVTLKYRSQMSRCALVL